MWSCGVHRCLGPLVFITLFFCHLWNHIPSFYITLHQLLFHRQFILFILFYEQIVSKLLNVSGPMLNHPRTSIIFLLLTPTRIWIYKLFLACKTLPPFGLSDRFNKQTKLEFLIMWMTPKDLSFHSKTYLVSFSPPSLFCPMFSSPGYFHPTLTICMREATFRKI